MLNSTGEGYVKKINVGFTDSGDWYMRFFLVDETGAKWLCKTLNKERHEQLKAGNYVSILGGTWRVWKNGVPYLEVDKMNKSETKNYQRQKIALDIANKILT